MRFSVLYYLLLIPYFFSVGCANPGKSLSGGAKDETPPKLVASIPENFSTNFVAVEVELEFDEFLKPGSLAQKLIISPVMDQKPEVKIKGKSVQIIFNSELLPDRTYTLNFGDAIADLNESNPIENFLYVFSTGDVLDSLEITGSVTSAFTNEPVEGVAVMLYQEDIDSLPLTDLPIYLSLTDKEGQYHLKNLASGSYKIFALKDANNNYLFDQPKEEIAFLDTLITPGARLIEEQVQISDSIPLNDTIPTSTKDSTNLPPEQSAGEMPDSTLLQDSTIQHPERSDGEMPDSTLLQDSTILPPEQSARVEYYPNNINLKLFTEIYKKQYITSTTRPTANKIEIVFNQPLDSLLITHHSDTSTYTSTQALSTPQALTYPITRDSVSIWLLDSTLYQHDTLTYHFSYTAFDSLEQPIPHIDTVVFSFRSTPPKKGEKESNPFKISSNFNRTKELGIESQLFFTEPWKEIDTSKIDLSRTRDTLRFKENFLFAPDTLSLFNVRIEKINTPNLEQNQDSLSQYPPINPLILNVQNSFLIDSSYSLTLFPGAFTSYSGLTNDTTKISFKVNNPDKYGTVLLSIDSLFQPAILQMIKGKDVVVKEFRLDSSGVQNFSFVKPGKYKFKLIFDDNNNGKWDRGRYLKGIQPEAILLYEKELDVKANWEHEESWKLEEE